MAANTMATREVDDRVLRFLDLRMDGFTTPEIASIFCVTAGYVRSATNKVVKDDAELHDDMIAFPERKK